jgi:mRNA-degrading endonuclease toxin of MazEF toxin-antitoxin module
VLYGLTWVAHSTGGHVPGPVHTADRSVLDRVRVHGQSEPTQDSTKGKLREDSVALCSQIRAISIEHCINENLGPIPHERTDDVETALEYSLGLTEI